MTRKRALLVAVLVALFALAGLSIRSCVTAGDGKNAPVRPRGATSEPRTRELAVVRPERRRTVPTDESSAAAVPSSAGSDADTADTAQGDGGVDEVRLVVTARDGTGRPVSGVAVTVRPLRRFETSLSSGAPLLLAQGSAQPGSERAARLHGTTADTGVAQIAVMRVPDLRVTGRSDAWTGQVDVTPAKDAVTVDVSLTVVPAFRLEGRVVHDDGTPVSNARIYIAVPLPGRARRMPRRLQVVNSDKDGHFTCGSHPVPDTRIVECYVMAGTVAGASSRFPVTAGLRGDVELVIPRGTVIRGRCVDEEGEPLAGVRVRGIMPPTGEITMSGRDGRFSMPVPGGGGGLLFFLAGRVHSALRDLHGPPEGVDIGDVLIPRGGTIAGRLIDDEGHAIAGVEVVLIDPWTEHAAARPKTDAEGAFGSEVIGAGTHFALAAVRRSGDPPGLHCYFRFEGLHAGDTDLTLTVPRGVWVEVVVHDVTSGAPLQFEKGVFTLVRDGAPHIVPVHRVFETGGETRSSFMVQVPAPGSWSFEVELPVSGRADRRTFVVAEEPGAPIVLTPR